MHGVGTEARTNFEVYNLAYQSLSRMHSFLLPRLRHQMEAGSWALHLWIEGKHDARLKLPLKKSANSSGRVISSRLKSSYISHMRKTSKLALTNFSMLFKACIVTSEFALAPLLMRSMSWECVAGCFTWTQMSKRCDIQSSYILRQFPLAKRGIHWARKAVGRDGRCLWRIVLGKFSIDVNDEALMCDLSEVGLHWV